MKKLAIATVFICARLMLNAQSNAPTLVLKYVEHTIPVSVVQKEAARNKLIENMGMHEGWKELIHAMFSDSGVHRTYIHLDTALSITYHDGIFSSIIGFGTNQEDYGIELKNGNKIRVTPTGLQKSVDNTIGKGNYEVEDWTKNKGEDTRKLKRKEKINNYLCEIWQLNLPKYNSTTQYWVLPKENTPKGLSEKKWPFYKGQFIIKSETHSTTLFENTKTLDYIGMDTLENFSIKQKMDALFAETKGMDKYYTDLAENSGLSAERLDVGSHFPDFKFKSVDSETSKSLDSIRSGASYLLIDIWASWCGPCVKGFPEIQKLKDEYGDALQILSLNYADPDVEKVKKVLDKQLPSWPQGYASHQINDLINSENAFPAMVLLDQQRRVVMLGKPELTFDQIRLFLTDKLK
jgi:thiol-disulfide isomerase/thioredoxin